MNINFNKWHWIGLVFSLFLFCISGALFFAAPSASSISSSKITPQKRFHPPKYNFSSSRKKLVQLTTYLERSGIEPLSSPPPAARRLRELTPEEQAQMKEETKINVNTADARTLQYVKGIGPSMAGRILKLRNGPDGKPGRAGVDDNGNGMIDEASEAGAPGSDDQLFHSLQDLRSVKGVGEKTFEKLKKNLRVGKGANQRTFRLASTLPIGAKNASPEAAALSFLNTADLKALLKLQRIGPTTAKEIIRYRKSHGGFTEFEQLHNVKGIQIGTFTALKEQLLEGRKLTATSEPSSAIKKHQGNLININTADEAEFRKLKGVGKKKAAKIIEDRDANGPFKTIDDLARIKGIGKKTVAKWRDQLTVDGTSSHDEQEKSSADEVNGNASSSSAGGDEGKININTATASEFQALKGVGKKKSQKIIEDRDANGPFKSIDDLVRIKGIGKKTVAKWRDQLTAGDGEISSTRVKKVPNDKKDKKEAPTGDLININTATASDFQKLKGVGKKKAAKIIADRKANGSFKSINDLARIRGIGKKTINKWRDQLTLGKGK